MTVLARLLMAVPMLLVTAMGTFFVLHLVPGDPVRTMLGLHATSENVAATRAQLGLDRPLPDQFISWMAGLFRGDLGQDFLSGNPVRELIARRLPVTIELTATSMLLGVIGGVGLGLFTAGRSGVRRGLGELFSVVGISIPNFWLGIVLSLVLGGWLYVLPPSGYATWSEAPADHVAYMVLPVLTLAIGQAAYLSRVTRAIASDLLNGPSVAFLNAKGLSRSAIVLKHVVRQASPPVATIIGIEVGVLLGGSIIIETIFGLPGLGSLVVTAVQQRNFPVIQGCVLVISALFILVTVATDALVALLDPRTSEAGTQ